MDDLLIRGGHVIDPAHHLNTIADVAIRDGRIAAVAPALDPSQAREVIDASGLIVTPGLVDLHTHVYWGVTYWGIEADPVAARSGVTTTRGLRRARRRAGGIGCGWFAGVLRCLVQAGFER